MIIEDITSKPVRQTVKELTRFLAPNKRIKTEYTRASTKTSTLRSCVSAIAKQSGQSLGVQTDPDGSIWIVRYR